MLGTPFSNIKHGIKKTGINNDWTANLCQMTAEQCLLWLSSTRPGLGFAPSVTAVDNTESRAVWETMFDLTENTGEAFNIYSI